MAKPASYVKIKCCGNCAYRAGYHCLKYNFKPDADGVCKTHERQVVQ